MDDDYKNLHDEGMGPEESEKVITKKENADAAKAIRDSTLEDDA